MRRRRRQSHRRRRLLHRQLVHADLFLQLRAVRVRPHLQPHPRHTIVRGHRVLKPRPRRPERHPPRQVQPIHAPVLRKPHVELAPVVHAVRPARPQRHLRRRRPREVQLPAQRQTRLGRRRRPPRRQVPRAPRPLVRRVRPRRPPAVDPVRKPAVEPLRERQRLRPLRRVLRNGHVVDEPAVARQRRVALHVKADAQVRLPAPARQVDPLLRPLPARARHAIHPRPGRPVLRHVQDAPVARRRVVERVPVPEPQHRPRRPRQVHRRQRVVVRAAQIHAIETERRVSQAGASRRVGLGCYAPRAHQIPVQRTGLKAVREGQRIIGGSDRCLLSFRRIGAVGRYGIDAIGVLRVQCETGIGPFRLRLIAEERHALRKKRRPRRSRHAMYGIMRKNGVGILRPTQPHGVRRHLIQQKRGHGIRRFGHRNVVQPPTVPLPRRTGGEPKAHQHRGLPRHRRQTDTFTGPRICGGRPRIRFQRRPIRTVVDGDLDHAHIAA